MGARLPEAFGFIFFFVEASGPHSEQFRAVEALVLDLVIIVSG